MLALKLNHVSKRGYRCAAIMYTYDYINYKLWDEITNPFLNFNGCTVEV